MVKRTIFGVERDIDIPDEDFPTEDEFRALEDTVGPNCEHGWFDSCHGGAKLHYRKWLPAEKPKAILIHTHGIQTHSGNGHIMPDGRKLDATLRKDALNQVGCAVYAHDLYGHGYSEGTRWLIPEGYHVSLNDLCTFVNLVAKENDPSIPIILMGESYGALLTLFLARQFQDKPETGPKNFDSIILAASAIEADLPPAPVRFVLRNILAPRFPKWTPFFMPNPVSSDRIWREPEIVAIKTDPRTMAMKLESGGTPLRLGTAAAIVDALAVVKAEIIAGFKTPYCLMHGTHDAACPISGPEFLWNTAETPEAHREFHRFEGLYHDLFADPEQDKCIKAVVAWVERRLL